MKILHEESPRERFVTVPEGGRDAGVTCGGHRRVDTENQDREGYPQRGNIHRERVRTSHYGDELRFDIVAVDDEKRGEREVGEVGKNGRGNSCRQQGGGERKDGGGGDNAKSCGNYYIIYRS